MSLNISPLPWSLPPQSTSAFRPYEAECTHAQQDFQPSYCKPEQLLSPVFRCGRAAFDKLDKPAPLECLAKCTTSVAQSWCTQVQGVRCNTGV